MKATIFLVALGFFALCVHAHTEISAYVTVNNRNQLVTSATNIRPTVPRSKFGILHYNSQWPISGSTAETNFPNGISSQNYTCGHTPGGLQPARATTTVAAGSIVGVQYINDNGGPKGQAQTYIGASHKGPFMVYMAPLSSNGRGNVWFKVYQAGKIGNFQNCAVPNDCQWASTDLLAQGNGKLSFQIPAKLKAGDYLVRTELIALHSPGAAQAYVQCGQFKVTGTGTALPAGVAIPGPTMDINHPAYQYNLYYNPGNAGQQFPFPGPNIEYGLLGVGAALPTADEPGAADVEAEATDYVGICSWSNGTTVKETTQDGNETYNVAVSNTDEGICTQPNSHCENTACICNTGFVANADLTACVQTSEDVGAATTVVASVALVFASVLALFA